MADPVSLGTAVRIIGGIFSALGGGSSPAAPGERYGRGAISRIAGPEGYQPGTLGARSVPDQGPNPGGFEVLPPLILEPGDNPDNYNERGDPIGGDSDVEFRDRVGLPQVPPGGREVYPVDPLPPAPLPGGPSDADNMLPRWQAEAISGPWFNWIPAGGRRRGGKRTKKRRTRLPPALGFVGTLPTIATETATVSAAGRIAATVAPWLGWIVPLLWPSEISPDVQPAPSGPTRRTRPRPAADPIEPYPDRRQRRRTIPWGPAIPIPDWQLPRVEPFPYEYVPMPDPPYAPAPLEVPLPETLPEIPTMPAPSTPTVPGTLPRRAPAPLPGPPAWPGLPSLLPYLPLFVPGTRPGSRPSVPAFPTPTNPATPLLSPIDPWSRPPGQVDPLTPTALDPLSFSQPYAPPRNATSDCVDLLKRRPKTRKCIARDNCGKCTRYRKL